MRPAAIRKLCLSLPGATESIQWGGERVFDMIERASPAHSSNALTAMRTTAVTSGYKTASLIRSPYEPHFGVEGVADEERNRALEDLHDRNFRGAAHREQVEADRRRHYARLDVERDHDAEVYGVDLERHRDREDDRHGEEHHGDAVHQRSEYQEHAHEGEDEAERRESPSDDGFGERLRPVQGRRQELEYTHAADQEQDDRGEIERTGRRRHQLAQELAAALEKTIDERVAAGRARAHQHKQHQRTEPTGPQSKQAFRAQRLPS